MVIYLKKMMEQLISGDYKIIFGTILCNLNIGLMKSGRNKKRFQSCTDTSRQEILYLRALLGVTQGAMSLILHCRTMY